MRKYTLSLLTICLPLSLTACGSSISLEDYTTIVSENDSLKAEIEFLSEENQRLSDLNGESNSTFVVNKNMNISFNFGDRDGVYTGLVNSDGLPDGFGQFKNTSSVGNNWIYYGEWNNGHFNGNGITQWDAYSHMGLYEMDYMEGVGMYYFNDGSIFCGEFSQSEPVKSYIPNSEDNNTNMLESSLPNDNTNTTLSHKYDIGTYKVGHTISAGEYVLINNRTSDGSLAELEINIDSSGQFSSIGLMMETNSFAYFVLQEGEYLEIKRGQVIPVEDYERPSVSSYQSIPSGMYIVGEDIPSGEYELKSTNDKKAHYTIYNEIPSSKDGIVYSLDYFDVNTFITLKEGSYILYKNSEMSLINSNAEN